MYIGSMDNRISVNILAYNTYQKMKLSNKDMRACYNELYGFIENSVQNVGTVKLPITLGKNP